MHDRVLQSLMEVIQLRNITRIISSKLSLKSVRYTDVGDTGWSLKLRCELQPGDLGVKGSS